MIDSLQIVQSVLGGLGALAMDVGHAIVVHVIALWVLARGRQFWREKQAKELPAHGE